MTMQVKKTCSWADFDEAIKRLRDEYEVYSCRLPDGGERKGRNKLLFRGQADATWPLSTTLERKTTQKFSVLRYATLALATQNEIESFTGQRWTVPGYDELEKIVQAKYDDFVVNLPAYEYLVYLRHHGFPSPLLDWTESPYIAAYFAYLHADKSEPAVYCFVERTNGSKCHAVGAAQITLLGPYATTHKRHFAQKAQYTIATKLDRANNQHVFCPHEDVFAVDNEEQDVLIKIALPLSEKTRAMRILSDYNINHFTLFQSEDALIRAMENKLFDLMEPDE